MNQFGSRILQVGMALGFTVTMFTNLVGAEDRPSLLFREDWTETEAECPVNQNHVSHPDLILHLHGPGRDLIKKSHHETPSDDPYYLWSGLSDGANWAVSLELANTSIDLTGKAKIRWRARQSGFRVLRVIVQQASGHWLVADPGDDASNDWRVREFNVVDLKWRRLNIAKVVEQRDVIPDPDLSHIRQIGFTDLMTGGLSQACSRLDWIEVYAVPTVEK